MEHITRTHDNDAVGKSNEYEQDDDTEVPKGRGVLTTIEKVHSILNCPM